MFHGVIKVHHGVWVTDSDSAFLQRIVDVEKILLGE